MNTKICYRFTETTGEFLGPDMAFQEPIGGTYPLPAHCTFDEPPKTDEFEIPVFEKGHWKIKKDYRQHFSEGSYVGGKPYYDPADHWWAYEQYMQTIGDIPAGMSFTKIARPQICDRILELEEIVRQALQYLEETDYIHLVILEEPEKADSYREVIEERKKRRALVDPTREEVRKLKEELVKEYGEKALYHIW